MIEWHRTITPDNDDNSCIIKQDTVVNIASWWWDPFLLIQNAISILSYLPTSKNVKFKFHSLDYIDIEFLNMYIERYNVENETISFSSDLIESDLNRLIDIKKRIQSESQKTTRNVFMMVFITNFEYLNEICSNDENVKFIQSTKDLQLYYNYKKTKNCTDKKIFDPDVNIFNYDHFFEEVKKLVCN